VVPTNWLAKVRLEGERLIPGTGGGGPTNPVPESDTDCGLRAPLLGMFSVADRLPAALGVKVTATVQLAPRDNVAPLVAHGVPLVGAVSAKSPPFAPLMEMLLTVKSGLPLLVRVTVWEALVVLRVWLAKLRLVGDSVSPCCCTWRRIAS
jgi:hypothetical protein